MPSTQYHGDVGVVVTGRTHIQYGKKSNGLAPLEEEKFYRITGIRASWQARVCLMFLLEYVDVQILELRRVWGRELIFENMEFVVRTSRYQKWCFMVAASAFVLHALSILLLADQFTMVDFGNSAAKLIGLGGLAMLIEHRIYYPFRIAQKLKLVIEDVNDCLPERLERARLDLWQGPGG
jgi:hypothetical protein